MEPLILTHTIKASLEKAFSAVTDRDALVKWYPPKGITMTIIDMELKDGGKFFYKFDSPQGVMYGRFNYQKVEKPSSLFFTNFFADEHGNPIRHPLLATWPLEMMNEWTLQEEVGHTLLTMKAWPINATEEEEKTFQEFKGTISSVFEGLFKELDEYVEGSK